MWIQKFYYFLALCTICHECLDLTSLEEITEATCPGENCENVTQFYPTEINTQLTEITESSTTPEDDYEDESSGIFPLFPPKPKTPQKPLLPVGPRKPNTENKFPGSKKKKAKIEKTKTEICECDLKMYSCDINCCCDLDCTDYQMRAFSFCSDNHEKLYDRRYCYIKNFIYRNHSKFILEKLADNLFCIAYDNLPPVFIVNNNVTIHSDKDFVEVMNEVVPEDSRWSLEHVWIKPSFYNREAYRHGDPIWKFDKNSIEPLEFLQTGFTAHCSFKRPIKFLEGWKGSCLQTDLSNSNYNLFPERYHDFTVIKSPLLIDLNKFNRYQKCSENLCAPIETNYCLQSWTSCSKIKTNPTSCSNGKCENVIRSVRYIIRHNGTLGIIDFRAYFKEANVSGKFHQEFEVVYEWANDDRDKIFERSGNPGYIMGNPIFVAASVANRSHNTETKDIILDKKNVESNYLALPVSKPGGECDEREKYIVNFGENVKSRCKLKIKTKYFSSSTCSELQNRTLELLMAKSFSKFSDSIKMQISKLGNIFDSNATNWVEVFFNHSPRNLVTGRILGDKIWCSGLITSMRVDIIHAILSKPEFLDNHAILGVGITFANKTDISWPKCENQSCIETLDVEIVSYASFHDASKPARIYFASGPNLDISLPYDFFYPFLSSSLKSMHSFNLLMSCLFIAIFSCEIRPM